MILEAVNSVFLTFVVTEYLINDKASSSLNNKHSNGDDDDDYRRKTPKSAWRNISQISHQLKVTLISRHSRPIQYSFVVVACINLFVHYHNTGAAISQWMHSKLDGINVPFVPRIVIAMTSFLVALYWDCRRVVHSLQPNNNQNNTTRQWSNRLFLRQLLQSFCRLLPIYPFLAVVISFGFLFLITTFETLHLPLEILNMPIYYGTMYGPLSLMYWDAKKAMVKGAFVNGGARVLGGIVLPR
jgi:hypothetical protein|eukprot:scaffold968_cov174-Alexandrium_tamarense.AAC.9